ncbi:transcription factor IIIA isoform X2 [Rosa rugosa]|uniref:transcription factor IIIA isoform X2 n=1 Tax=Rosa rugosa TaxID=74645 RepID=UPI002B40353D|nr:transcription factor IIIA isoform X2 [Rosa rugosa]XP_061988526.1 transcription factor IIIA isoform X2 [Rosa rugosa]XP_061988527.1 transcription factor IIIA isoform X2 [Rosa rugosa]
MREGSDLNGLVPGGRPPVKLHQVNLSHARPYVCSVDDCHSSYRRKDHLTRHLFHHQGKLFKCPIENCNSEFAFQGNMTRHVSELHGEDCPSANDGCQKQHVCQEKGCGKVFRFASQLRKHEDSHVKLDRVEAFCSEPGCMKQFPNEQCLKAHIQSCHQHITCEICGTKQLKKNIKSHLRTHEEGGSMERIKCDYEGCLQTFTKKSNLRQHVKAVHLENKPFVCCFPGCGKRFAYKHVKDNHEKSGCHVHAHGDFEEADEKFRSRPRGGRKRQCPTVEMLVRKRVSPSKQSGQDTESF